MYAISLILTVVLCVDTELYYLPVTEPFVEKNFSIELSSCLCQKSTNQAYCIIRNNVCDNINTKVERGNGAM